MFDSLELNKCAMCGYDRPSVTITEERNGIVAVKPYCLECASKAGISVLDWAIKQEQREKAERNPDRAG